MEVKDMNADNFSAVDIRVAMALLDINRTQLARRLRVDVKTITNYARGSSPVPYTTAVYICQLVEDVKKEKNAADASALVETVE
jgi:transcriptional regulator with XRE-family HTH domain